MAPIDFLNKVEATVRIASMAKDIHFVSLKLDQRFNDHHRFEIEVNAEELDVDWMVNPITTMKHIGQEVTIVMKHKFTGETNLFEGLITNIKIVGRNGQRNNIVISGCSPTIRLDGKETMDSFVDKSLKAVVDEAVESSGNGGKVLVAPAYTGQIDYINQWSETAYQFLNRLSYLYGEWFFYDGKQTFFGNPKDKDEAVTLIYDQDLVDFNLSASIQPPVFNRYTYLVHTDLEPNSPAPDTVPGADGYTKIALDKSKEIYTSNAYLRLEPLVSSKEELDYVVAVEKSRTVANMFIFEGTSKTCKVKLGKTIKIVLPNTMANIPNKEVSTFLVTHVSHEFNQEGHYTNSFTGIPSEIMNIPMKVDSVTFPSATIESAIVTDNADSKGRVKVQFQWQKIKGKSTNWIRVQTPDAGSSADVADNRGFVFIPEIGDRVMVGFEFADPNRPFVMGSIYPETKSTGGKALNNVKTLTDKSGNYMKMDAGKGMMELFSRIGNSRVIMDGIGNVTISAPRTLTLAANDIYINAGNSINLNADPSYGTAAGSILSFAPIAPLGEIKVKAKKKMEVTVVEEDIKMTAETKDIILESKSAKITIKAKTDMLLGAEAKLEIKTPDMKVNH